MNPSRFVFEVPAMLLGQFFIVGFWTAENIRSIRRIRIVRILRTFFADGGMDFDNRRRWAAGAVPRDVPQP